MDRMIHYFDIVYDSFTTKDKYICGTSTILGWFLGINFFNWVSWGPVLSGLMSIAIASFTALAGAVTLDFYKLRVKDRLFKNKGKKQKIEDKD